ncbi:MAG TPA: hypothetical protein VFH58_14975 [Acidimicrobiales bacterium]|nr:hypothetical protein [Acidimicrobiales bacterium]
MALFRRQRSALDPASGEPPSENGVEAAEPALRPSRMRGTEPLYGYVIGLELLVVAILQMVVRGGKGAPAHPQTGLQIVAIAVSVAFFGVLQLRNRTIVGFAAIIAAFFVTLPRVPNSLGVVHIFALVFPLAYGLIISQRQRKEMMAAARNGRGARAGGGSRRERARADAVARRSDRRRGKGAEPAPSGPRPSARYTPPKAKRGDAKGRGKGKVAGS